MHGFNPYARLADLFTGLRCPDDGYVFEAYSVNIDPVAARVTVVRHEWAWLAAAQRFQLQVKTWDPDRAAVLQRKQGEQGVDAVKRLAEDPSMTFFYPTYLTAMMTVRDGLSAAGKDLERKATEMQALAENLYRDRHQNPFLSRDDVEA